MEIRKIKCEEKSYILDFNYNIFKETDYSDGKVEKALIQEIRESENYIEDLEIVATKDSKILGYSLFSKFYIEGKEILLLAPVCVAKDSQKMGIGKAILKYGLDIAKKMGFKGVIVLGEPDFYKKVGFNLAENFNIIPKDTNIPKEYLMVVELYKNSLSDISGKVDYSLYKALS